MGWSYCQSWETQQPTGNKNKGRICHASPVTPRDTPPLLPFRSSNMLGALVSVQNLTFIPQGALEPALEDISLSLPKGSRTLLIGANGG